MFSLLVVLIVFSVHFKNRYNQRAGGGSPDGEVGGPWASCRLHLSGSWVPGFPSKSAFSVSGMIPDHHLVTALKILVLTLFSNWKRPGREALESVASGRKAPGRATSAGPVGSPCRQLRGVPLT